MKFSTLGLQMAVNEMTKLVSKGEITLEEAKSMTKGALASHVRSCAEQIPNTYLYRGSKKRFCKLADKMEEE